MTSLIGQHVIITGGSQGIGMASAAACVARGARVSIIARDPSKLHAAHKRIPGIATPSADVTDAVALASAIRGIEASAWASPTRLTP